MNANPRQRFSSQSAGTSTRTGAAWVHGVWLTLLFLSAVLVVVPLPGGGEGASLRLASWLPGFLAGGVERSYLLVKGAMLWLAMGALLSLIWPSSAIRGGAVSLVAISILAGWMFLPDFGWKALRDVLFMLPGLAVGLWLGERSRLSDAFSKAKTAAPGLISGRADGHETDAPVPAVFQKKRALGGVDMGVSGEPAHQSDAPLQEGVFGWRRMVGLGLLLGVLVALIGFPRWEIVLGLGLALYLAALWWRPTIWLVGVPAALPLLDLAPWTGRFFLDEFDLLLLATAGVLYLRGRRQRAVTLLPLAGLWIGLFAILVLVSGIVGVLPLPSLDANAFSSYWSSYNSLRVAKGFLWGALIFWLLRREGMEADRLGRLLAIGMGLGLLGVGLVGVWERWLFAGFADAGQTYRIVSTFSSMHTGGGHIEAYLVAALPFLWLGTTRLRHLALAVPLMLLTAYVVIYTVSRGGGLAMGVALFTLLVGSLRLAKLAGNRQFIIPAGVLLALAAVLAAGMGGSYFQQRLAQSGQDWQIRWDHWSQALAMRDSRTSVQLFGMGLGSFPRTYLQSGPANNQPATYGFAVDQGNPYLRLGSGETLYYAQRVPVEAGRTYRLELDVRSASKTRLDTPVCEKQLLNSRQCVWFGFDVPGDGQWHTLSRSFSSEDVGRSNGLSRPPVELFLHHPGKGVVLDVDRLRLLDADGRELLCNGDFGQGADCWFFKTHSHLPWHIKNVWVHVLFEQGWLGLLLFTGLTALALSRLAGAAWRGQRLAWVWLASLLGLLTVGMFDSLLDAPRLAALLVALILLGVGYDWEWLSRPVRRRRKRSRNNPDDISRSA